MKIGFQFVPFPREIWDNSIDLSKSEFRLLGWFLSGLRLGVEQARYTDDELLFGCEGRPPLGLARNSMKEARDGLILRGLLEVRRLSRTTSSYSVIVSEIDTQKVSESNTRSVNSCHSEYQSPTLGVSISDSSPYIDLKPETTERAEGGDSPDLPASALARGLLEKVNLPVSIPNLKSAGAAIEAVAKQYGFQLNHACDWLEEKARGNQIDKFWFEDARYNGNGKQPSKAKQRVIDNSRVVLEDLFGPAAGPGGCDVRAGNRSGRDAVVGTSSQGPIRRGD